MGVKLYLVKQNKMEVDTNTILKKIIQKERDVSCNKINFYKSEYGKPHLKNIDLYFNISHTSGMSVIAMSDSNIGVDVENIDNVIISKNKIKRISMRFFTISEQKYIFNETKGQVIRFYEIWTKNEAYVKYQGKSLVKEIKNFCLFDNHICEKMKTIKKEQFIISICSSQFKTVEKNCFEIYVMNDKKFVRGDCYEC